MMRPVSAASATPPLDRWRIEIKAMIFIGFPQAASMSVNSYCTGWFKTTVLA
ncbi:hypothetical protein BM590_B0157 [Brucella melitensis M5-90]|nr:hypothetical protein BM590_B0157 [Brucella melitensis M5-90]AEW15794.1 Phosphotransferase system, galactitol-specific IIC component [Brucella canis HSK A52141]